MLSTPEFWVFVSFILFLALFGKRMLAYLTQSLDEHSQKIAFHLEEAQHLHDEALNLLNSYKKKYEDAQLQAEEILALAEREALAFKKASEQELEQLLEQKEKALLERIAIEMEETKSKLRNQVVDEAVAIVEDFLLENLKERKKLTKASLKEISMGSLKPRTTQENQSEQK